MKNFTLSNWEGIPIFEGYLDLNTHMVTYSNNSVAYDEDYGFIIENYGTIFNGSFMPKIIVQTGTGGENKLRVIGGVVAINRGRVTSISTKSYIGEDHDYMNENGQLTDAFKIILPFDINADVITIKDNDYGIWYIDTFDHKENYDGKIVEFNAMVVMSKKLPKNSFIAGRLAMTCCSNDIQLYGHLCVNSLNTKLKDRSFIHLKAKVSYKYSKEYQEEECTLIPLSIEVIQPLENPVLDLTK